MPPRTLPSSSPESASDHPGLRIRSWLTRFLWADLAVIVASGAYLALFSRTRSSYLPDEGLIATAAERILRGQIPYRDFFSELGPCSFYLQAAIFKFSGLDVFSLRLTAWSLGVAMSWLIFCLSDRVMSRPAACLPSAIFVTAAYPVWYQSSHHHWGTFFFLLMILCLSTHAKDARGTNPTWSKPLLVVAGVLSGAAALCMQSVGAFAVLTGLTWLVAVERWPGGRTWRGAVRSGATRGLYFLLGVGIAAGLMAAYFWAHGALWPWIEDNLVFLFTNYQPYESEPNAYSWVRFSRLIRWLLKERSEQALVHITAYYLLCLVGPAIAFAGAMWQRLRPERVDPPRSRLLLLYLLGAVGALLSEVHEAHISHFTFSAPLMLVLLVSSCLHACRRWPGLRRPLQAVTVLAMICAVLLARHRVVGVAGPVACVQCRRGTVYRYPEQGPRLQRWLSTIENTVPAGEDTFFFPEDAHLYFLTGTRNPTRYDVLLDRFNSPNQIQEAIRTLNVRRPNYIFSFDQVDRFTAQEHLPDERPDILEMHPLEKVLRGPQSPYRLEGEIEGMEIWTLKK